MYSALKKVLGILGPGIVTGAADDDPSGIATYAQTGAQFGYGQLWTVFVYRALHIYNPRTQSPRVTGLYEQSWYTG